MHLNIKLGKCTLHTIIRKNYLKKKERRKEKLEIRDSEQKQGDNDVY